MKITVKDNFKNVVYMILFFKSIYCFATINPVSTTQIPTAQVESSSAINKKNVVAKESEPVLSKQEIIVLKHVAAERSKLEEYSGVLGTAPENKTITSIGAATEELLTGPDAFIYFTQTLASGFYYEGRLYGKYNMDSENTAFPDVPETDEHNPNGGKIVVKLGYNFHVTPDYDLTPYLRLEAGHNWSMVYADSTGNNITSINYAILPGMKQTFILSRNLNPYIDIYGGLVQSTLNGVLTQGANANVNQTASVQQFQITNEIGFAYKITDNSAIIPYTQFIYSMNNPNSLANASYNDGGFNISALSSTAVVWAIKYSYSW